MVFGQVVHFCQILLFLENSVEVANKSHCKKTMLALEQTMDFLFFVARYQMCSILMRGLYICAPPSPTLNERNVVVSIAVATLSRPTAIANKVCSYQGCSANKKSVGTHPKNRPF